MDKKKLINEMTLDEKLNFLIGHSNMQSFKLDRLNIKPIVFSDGPNGLRIESSDADSLSGISRTLESTCFPSGVLLSSMWNKELMYKTSEAISEEMKYYGVNVLLGPAINIKRNPLCGRNFEYYSEDPYLTGALAIEFVKGLENNNVGACLKHFAANNNEKNRYVGDSIIDDRALHEIYLKPFEMAVKNAKPKVIMTSYNKVNGVHASENSYLQNEILRDKWGFDGLSITDWGGIKDRDKALINGCDIEMPGSVNHSIDLLKEALNNKTLDIKIVDRAIERILDVIDKTDNPKQDTKFNEHYDLCVKLVEDGAVLLKNDNDILPLDSSNKCLVIGDFFRHIRYQGAGSALLNPYKIKTHEEVFKENNINYEYYQGYEKDNDKIDKKLEDEAVSKAKDTNGIILFFGGLDDFTESEGFDRKDMFLKLNQVSLIRRLLELKKKIIFIYHGGSSIELDELDKFDGILNVMLGGSGLADGTYNLLFGKTSPSGKLTETWMKHYSDVPFYNEFTKTPIELYKESIFVGYRYYNSHKDLIKYPFGYGLSYSKFEYSDLKIEKEDLGLKIKYKIKNTGKIQAKEVSEVYASHESKLPMPLLELKGFDKTLLNPGETKEIEVFIDYNVLKVYYHNDFVLEDSTYRIMVGDSSTSIKLTDIVKIDGVTLEDYDKYLYDLYDKGINIKNIKNEDFFKLYGKKIEEYKVIKPFTMETPIREFDTLFGKIFKKAVVNVGHKQYKKALKIKDPKLKEREMKAGYFVEIMMPNNSLRSIVYASNGMLKYNTALGIVEMVNGHPIKGIKKMLTK